MPGDQDAIARREDLLRECVVFVDAGDQGTGFLVAADLVLTCRHVVQRALGGAVPITVRDASGRVLAAELVNCYPGRDAERNGFPDLALLRITAAGPLDLPAVILDSTASVTGADLTVGGHPANTKVGYQTRHYTSQGQANYDSDGRQYLRISGDRVEPGLSGAPVMNEAGFVCGYVRLQVVDGGVLGGFVVPIASVVNLNPELNSAYLDPGPAARRWSAAVEQVDMKERGRDPHGAIMDRTAHVPEILDIELDVHDEPGNPLRSWKVSVVDEASCHEVVAESQLGPGVFNAVHHWARRHPVRSEADVTILSDLLARALLPVPVSQRLQATIARGGSPLIRIKLGDVEDLAEIPWEFANVDAGGRNVPIAAHPELAMSRYVDIGSRLPAEPRDGLRVLIVVPKTGSVGHRARKAATSTSLSGALVKELARWERFATNVVAVPSFDEVQRELAATSYDLVHFIGYATQDLSGIGFAGFRDEIVGTPLPSVGTMLRDNGVQVVVLQLLTDDPNHLSTLATKPLALNLLGDCVEALVVAEHPLDAEQVMSFNTRFYQEIQAGRSVEMAVQLSRKKFLDTPPQQDYAAFGSISVTTTREGNVRLLRTAPAHPATAAQGASVGSSKSLGQRSVEPAPDVETGGTWIARG